MEYGSKLQPLGHSKVNQGTMIQNVPVASDQEGTTEWQALVLIQILLSKR